ncbi:tetratricopeptide repeat protein [Nocardia sp. NEAU-351]|uniref:Tetratricopeptide repeat protein n=2 Tax=Nocardia bovistercoris TaxID=2785916 RepID=A0A931I884_9NOCA|nr:phosphotransferase [Nocardia bovistercoris]MBH0775180.1 tetratricopeptide repeat protein [Nocardia bovistercoris]
MIPVDPEVLAARFAAARPEDFVGHRQTGIDAMLLGRYEDALDHLDRALELADTDGRRLTVWINLGDVYQYRGEFATATLLYRRAVDAARAVAPDALSFAVQHLGKALAEQGDPDAARETLGEALRLRVAEGDPELIESTRTALETIEQSPIPLPPAVTALLGAAPVCSDRHEGMSGGVVSVGGAYWMKRGPGAAAEYDRLRWLAEHGVRVPEIAVFEGDVLVLVDAGARSLATVADDGVSVGAALGAAARRLHDLPIARCPFDGGLDASLARARRRVLEGLVDTADFDEENAGRAPEEMLRRLLDTRPEESDFVVTHGDLTPANVLEGGIVLDVGGLGVADRYRDLALAERDLRGGGGGGERAVAAFFEAYGPIDPDHERSAYYRLLDELF